MECNMLDAIALAHDAGAGWVRLSCGWQRIEPQNNQWKFNSCDALIAAVRNAGMEIVFQLNTANQWCTTAPTTETGLAERELYPPCDYKEYRDFVHHVVSRYGPRSNNLGNGYGRAAVRHWEVWNEPDLRFYWRMPPPRPQTDAAGEYARLLDVAHDAIKNADPVAVVLLGGLALGGGSVDPLFFQKIMADPQHPAGGNFDIANFHTYENRAGAVAKLQQVKAQAGGRPVWITEFGYSSLPAYQRLAQYGTGEAGQAAYLEDVLPALLAAGADKVFWYTIVDPARDASQFCAHGLLFVAGYQCSDPASIPLSATIVKKQAYNRLRTVLATLPASPS